MIAIQLFLCMQHGRKFIGIIGAQTNGHDALALLILGKKLQPFTGRLLYPVQEGRALEAGITEIQQVRLGKATD